MNTPEEVWAKIDKRGPDECWLWTGSRFWNGYGHVSGPYYHIESRAHRLVYRLTYGPIPAGMCVCHRCDTPACCNPAHLWLGTHKENMLDMAAKRRTGALTHPERIPYGERRANARFTEEKVIRIRAAYATGKHSQAEIARVCGVSPSAIHGIVSGETWRHLLPPEQEVQP
jgi:hypothetical protein